MCIQKKKQTGLNKQGERFSEKNNEEFDGNVKVESLKPQGGSTLRNGNAGTLFSQSAFTLMELIVVIAIIALLVLIATPKLVEYKEKAYIARVTHDVTIAEGKVEEAFLINLEVNDWENSNKSLEYLAETGLYEKQGYIEASRNNLNSTNEDDLIKIPKSFKKDIGTTLEGDFYTNNSGKVYYSDNKKLSSIKKSTVKIKAIDELGDEIQVVVWETERLKQRTNVEVIAPDIPGFTFAGELQTVSLKPGEEYKDEITYEYTKDNIVDKEGLRREFMRELKKRPSSLKVNYYGTDITTGLNVGHFLRDLQESGSYYTNNMNSSSRATNGPLVKNSDGSYIIDIFNMKYRTSDSQEAFIEKEVKRIVEEKIDKNMNDFEKSKVIHDYIVERKKYDVSVVNAHNAYGFFNDGKGVCQSFALSAARLFDEAGIENYFVLGRATSNGKTELHTWNKVRIDGQWYNLDTTWSHSGGNDRDKYEYFLTSDEKLHKSHRPETTVHEPKATSEKYDEMFDGMER